MNTLRNWWSSRSGRERVLVALAAAALLGVLAWQAVMVPLGAARADLERVIAVRADALARLEAAAPALHGKTANATNRVPAERLLTHTERLLGQAGLDGEGTRIEPLTPDGARVRVSGARFDAVLAWLEALAGSGVAVPELDLRAAGPGSVDGSAVLRVPAGP